MVGDLADGYRLLMLGTGTEALRVAGLIYQLVISPCRVRAGGGVDLAGVNECLPWRGRLSIADLERAEYAGPDDRADGR